MADKDMRLRLVVRRNGLPEARLMWNARLDNDPTISKLLEQLNEDLPLEANQWGLEDYVVELHDQDGTDFECLHYQPVRSVLKPDDRVFIRALERDDNRRRRISGRHQISTDGRHLIDGVPFGRPRLKAPTGRPPVHIPPRKRRRITYDRHDDDEEASQRQDEDEPMLYLTNGEPQDDSLNSSSVHIGADFEDADAEDDDFDEDALHNHDEMSDSPPGEELNHKNDYPGSDSQPSSDSASDMSDEEDLGDELRDLVEENTTLEEGAVDEEKQSEARTLDLRALDKISVLRTAFPNAPVDLCEKILMAAGDNTKNAYQMLSEAFKPQLPESAVLNPQAAELVKPPSEIFISPQPPKEATAPAMDEDEDDEQSDEEQSDEDEERSAFIKQYDYRGLPPGSITSGKGLAAMANISTSFTGNKSGRASEDTSVTLNGHNKSPETRVEEEDDETSSSGTSSSSDNDTSSDESSEDNSDEAEEASSDSDSEADDSDLDADSDDSDDGGSVYVKGNRKYGKGRTASDDDKSNSPSSDAGGESESGESDSGPEETSTSRPQPKGQGMADDNDELMDETSDETSSDDSSDESSSDDSDSSESEVQPDRPSSKPSPQLVAASKSHASSISPVAQPPKTSSTRLEPPQQVAPGEGKSKTKSRNARRKAFRKAQKLGAENAEQSAPGNGGQEASSQAKADAETAKFEAKRQALLDAIANGGVEVETSNIAQKSTADLGFKRKREDAGDTSIQAQDNTVVGMPDRKSTEGELRSPSSDQKRRCVDLGAGRRMLFGALGLRNPKTKEDEDALKTKLMKNVRPLANHRLGKGRSEDAQLDKDSHAEEDEDPDAWRGKINYRAVECVHEDIELSEPPFPFVQRWDPQQHTSRFRKNNKRGGQSKRAQRNQAHFYDDSSRLSGNKRKHEESVDWDEDAYDETFNGVGDTTDDLILNYDDEEPGQDEGQEKSAANEASEVTDIDDLPSLPNDLSALPPLRPGEVKPGMVITWKKWSCSASTNWQPQISDVAAVVVRIDDDATGVEVCLAMRDRHLDGNEKRYDHSTGQRIYEKFEAPDIDEDEDEDGEDEGYRTLSFEEMQDPRILQQPIAGLEIMDTDHAEYIGEADANMRQHQEQQEMPMQLNGDVDTTGDVTSREPGPSSDVQEPSDRLSEEPRGIEAISQTTKEPVVEGASSTESHQSGQGQPAADQSMSDISQTSSPSRQLHETTSQMLENESSSNMDITTGAVDGPTLIADETVSDLPKTDPASDRDSSAPMLIDGEETEIITGTPRVVPHQMAVPSSVSSVPSGRQPDDTMDFDALESGPLPMVDDDMPDEHDAPKVQSEEIQLADSSESMLTPTRSPVRRAVTPPNQKIVGPSNLTSAAKSTPDSLASMNTIWCTALTSRNTQSPSKSQSMSATRHPRKSQAQRDLEYEEAMRKLDDMTDDLPDSSKITNSFPIKSQPASNLSQIFEKDEDSVVIKKSPPPPSRAAGTISPPVRRRRTTRPPLSFSLPPGTQVVDLSSDSEPVYTEDYADDDVDQTYSPVTSSSLSKGGSWAKKPRDTASSRGKASTAFPVSQPNGKRTGASGRKIGSSAPGGRKSLPTSSSTLELGQHNYRSRRKSSARF
ncbi:hypothetical protein F5Y15DRAFT_393765 [Xylariaceae sp. FL0016]|nr:hypothetical protein F5Y15DRAFT_393765 [Xylariaceae sp. FL0016]